MPETPGATCVPQDLDGINARLNNPKFMEKASPVSAT